MAVTSEGFVPATVHLKRGERIRLQVTRKTNRTCATEIVIKDLGINQPLPLDQAVTVEFTPRKAGQLRYACAMDMITGVLVVD
jgi:plastocyanin domain-containing protein